MSTKASDELPFRKQKRAMVRSQVSWTAGGASKSILSHLFPFESQMFFEHSLITRTVFIIKELIVMIIVMIIIVIIINSE